MYVHLSAVSTRKLMCVGCLLCLWCLDECDVYGASFVHPYIVFRATMTCNAVLGVFFALLLCLKGALYVPAVLHVVVNSSEKPASGVNFYTPAECCEH